MKRSEIEASLRARRKSEDDLEAMAYRESLGNGWRIEVDSRGLPLYAPKVRVVEARGATVGVDELSAAQLMRVAAVKAQIEAWWEDKGEWPIAPPPDRRMA